MTIQDYFNSLSETVKPEDIDGIDTNINFDLKGEEVYLEVKNQKIVVHQGQAENAEVSIKAKPEDLLSIINGDTNPMMAMMMGKLKINNPAAMMKYAKILGLM